MKCYILQECNPVAPIHQTNKRMSLQSKYTVNTNERTRVRAVAVPGTLLPLSGLIILLGMTIAILGLRIIG